MKTYTQPEDLLTVDFETALETLITFADTLKERSTFWLKWYDEQLEEAKKAHKMIRTELYGDDEQ